MSSEYYLARAVEAHAEACATPLYNVRERCLRSEAAWRAMAERVASTDAMRRSRYLSDGDEAVSVEAVPARSRI